MAAKEFLCGLAAIESAVNNQRQRAPAGLDLALLGRCFGRYVINPTKEYYFAERA